jgi:hypothetical protein
MLAQHVNAFHYLFETKRLNLLSKPSLKILLIFVQFQIDEEIRPRNQLDIPRGVPLADFSSMN